MTSNKPDDSIRVYSILGKPEGELIKMGDIFVTKKFHKNYLSDWNAWTHLNRGTYPKHLWQFDKALRDDLIERAKQIAKELNADAIVDLSVDQEHHAWTCYGIAVRVLKKAEKESSSKERNKNIREGKGDDAPPAKKMKPMAAKTTQTESNSTEGNNNTNANGPTAPKKLSPELAGIVGKKVASRAELMKLLWTYIKDKQLKDPDNRQYFTPDQKMSKVFGADKIKAFGMAKYLGSHLSDI